eukprot:symbB.v1.2.032152.t2/scaffold3710.1/size51634/2
MTLRCVITTKEQLWTSFQTILQAMQNKSMVSRGMAVLGAGGQCTREAHRRDNSVVNEGAKKNARSSQYRYHVDFTSDVPAETAEMWVGTPYAAWIEKDVQRKYAKEYTMKLQNLEKELDNEVRRREVAEAQLEDANEQLKLIPELQEQLLQSKLKGVAAVGLGNLHAVCRVILSEWRRHATANIVDRLRRRAPDVRRCHFEMVALHEEGMEHLKALHLRMLNTVERFMDKDAMIVRDNAPWPCDADSKLDCSEDRCEMKRSQWDRAVKQCITEIYFAPVPSPMVQRRSVLSQASRPRKSLCLRPLEFPGLELHRPEDKDLLLLPVGYKLQNHGMTMSKLARRESKQNDMSIDEHLEVTTKLPPLGRSNSVPSIPTSGKNQKSSQSSQVKVNTQLPPICQGRSTSLPMIAPMASAEALIEKRKRTKPSKKLKVRFDSELNEEIRLYQESWL